MWLSRGLRQHRYSAHFVTSYALWSVYGRYAANIIQMMHGSKSDIQIWLTRGWKCRMRAQLECDIFVLECRMNDHASSV